MKVLSCPACHSCRARLIQTQFRELPAHTYFKTQMTAVSERSKVPRAALPSALSWPVPTTSTTGNSGYTSVCSKACCMRS